MPTLRVVHGYKLRWMLSQQQLELRSGRITLKYERDANKELGVFDQDFIVDELFTFSTCSVSHLHQPIQ